MKVVWADFNARTEEDNISLTTVGSKRSLSETGAKVGERVWISDGELGVRAVIKQIEGRLYACPDWDSLHDWDDRR